MNNQDEYQIYQTFLSYLQPEPGKYVPLVFKFFIEHKQEIEKNWSKVEKFKLIKLALEDNLKKIVTEKFKVKIADKSSQGRQYNISSVASYYGDLLRLGQILFPEKLLNFKHQIIDFIPVAYFSDQKTILEILENISDEDLKTVNQIYSREAKDDRRYLLPDSYIYVTREFQKRGCDLKTPLEVLKSFVEDELILESDKRQALDSMRYFLQGDEKKYKQYAIRVFDKFLNSKNQKLSEIANAILIEKYKDDDAIKWRFDEIKRRFAPFEHPEGFHSVGSLEEEIDTQFFAKPLINLQDEKYLDYFFKLLDFSFKKNGNIYKRKNGYVDYLWKIAIAFVEKLVLLESFEPLSRLKEFVLNYSSQNVFVFRSRMQELEKFYYMELGKSKTFDQAMDLVDQISLKNIKQ